MNKSIITKSLEEFIWATTAKSDPLKEGPAFEFNVKHQCGEVSSKNWICKLKPGLILSFKDTTYKEDVSLHIETKYDCLKFAYFLSGKGNVDYNFWDIRLKRSFADELVHHSYVYFSPEIEGKIQFNANHRLQQFCINISPSVLLKYFNGQFDIGPYALREILAGSGQTSYFHTARISKAMLGAIHQILNCSYSGAMRQLYLESKAMELIVLKVGQIVPPQTSKKPSSKLSCDDRDRVQKAVDILVSNFEDPPGLFDLAKAVGTTHTRLNLGFRKIHGTTAFGFLRQIRLDPFFRW